MEREQLRKLPLGHCWTTDGLWKTFAAVWGGIGLPGKRPGFAVVGGLCQPREKGDYEIHVLDEIQNVDLRDLLRQCRGLAARYRTGWLSSGESFTWLGPKSMAAEQIAYELNQEGGRPTRPNRLTIHPTAISDMESPYSYMVAKLKECLAGDRKQLYLHGSKVEPAMREIQPGDEPYLQLGDYPPVEALAFVVTALREHGARMIDQREHPPKKLEPYDPMKFV